MSISFEIQPQQRSLHVQESAAIKAWWRLPVVQIAGLVLWSMLLFFYGLRQGDLYRTEGLRAIIGQEMHRTGDWLVPRLYGEPILTKPPMFYWAIAVTGAIVGEVNTWSARLPAALAGLVCVLIVYFTARRYSDAAGYYPLLAACVLPCSMMWLEKASSSEIDTMLVMWVLAAWACFLRVMEICTKDSVLRTQHSALLPWWLATLLCVAGGVLTKWTGFLFFYVMAIPLLAWRRQLWRLFHWHHLLAACVGVAVVMAWMGPVLYELGPGTVMDMLWKEGAPRVLHGKNASTQLLLETLLHPLKVLGIAAPWSLLVLYGVFKSKRNMDLSEEDKHARLFNQSLWCWAIFGTLMMTAFPDHNIRQSFSLVPAWTLLGSLALLRWMKSVNQHSLQRWIIAGLLFWCAVKVLYVEVLIPARYAKRPSLAEQASLMRQHVPPDQTLYLCKVKDECLMFNYGRTVRRLADWNQLPSAGLWCIFTETERTAIAMNIASEQKILDAQGETLILCRLSETSHAR